MSEIKSKYCFNRSKDDGFTLIEIIVVLIILSILAVLSVPKFVDLGENAKIKAIEAAVSEIKWS